jgi:hypothetical protein
MPPRNSASWRHGVIFGRMLSPVFRSALLAASACLAVVVLVPAVARTAGTAAAVAPSAAAAPVVVAQWHMDETSGDVMVDSVGGHNGTLNGVQLGLPGFGGSAYGFTRSVATVASTRALSPGRKKLTVTIHLNTTLAPEKPDWDLLRKGVFGEGVGDYKIEFQPTGQASCGFVGSLRSADLVAGPRLDDGRWHTVQCVKTTKEIRLVVDGRRFSKRASVGTISNSAPLLIGSRGGSEFFKGALDEASVVIG